MRIVTGGHALWMGGWSTQVHHKQDIIGGEGGLIRPEDVLRRYATIALPMGDVALLPPAHALADSLVFHDHRIMPADELDPDYIEIDVRGDVAGALAALGQGVEIISALMAPYERVLSGDDPELE